MSNATPPVSTEVNSQATPSNVKYPPMASPLDPAIERQIMERIQVIPAFSALKIQIETFTVAQCVAVMPMMPEFNGIFGSFHGGLLATAADTITCFALLTMVTPESPMATTDLSIRFLAPCATDVRVDARVIKCGRTLCPIEANLYDMNGKHVAVVQATYIRL